MIFRKLGPILGSDNLDVESNRVGWERSDAIFTAVFSLIEAGVVLGALRAGSAQLQSDALSFLWLIGYGATGLYVLTGSNYLVAAIFDRLGWTESRKFVGLAFRAITAIVAITVPYLVDALTSQVILEALR